MPCREEWWVRQEFYAGGREAATTAATKSLQFADLAFTPHRWAESVQQLFESFPLVMRD